MTRPTSEILLNSAAINVQLWSRRCFSKASFSFVRNFWPA